MSRSAKSSPSKWHHAWRPCTFQTKIERLLLTTMEPNQLKSSQTDWRDAVYENKGLRQPGGSLPGLGKPRAGRWETGDNVRVRRGPKPNGDVCRFPYVPPGRWKFRKREQLAIKTATAGNRRVHFSSGARCRYDPISQWATSTKSNFFCPHRDNSQSSFLVYRHLLNCNNTEIWNPSVATILFMK